MEKGGLDIEDDKSESFEPFVDTCLQQTNKSISEGSEHSEDESDQTYERSSISSIDNNEDIGCCLDWPLWQQTHNAVFNDVSDVLSDGNRLNKEINTLLKLVAENDKQDIPPSIGPQPPPYGEGRLPLQSMESNLNKQADVKPPHELNCQDNHPVLEHPNLHTMPIFPVNINNGFGTASFQSVPSVINVDSHWGYPTQVLMDQNNAHLSLGTMNKQPFEPVKATYRLERQQRRREKNRECSRMFRAKQRVKEDGLKRGKLEKEVILQSCTIESTRLRMALQGLQRNDQICNIAKSLLQIPPSPHLMEP